MSVGGMAGGGEIRIGRGEREWGGAVQAAQAAPAALVFSCTATCMAKKQPQPQDPKTLCLQPGRERACRPHINSRSLIVCCQWRSQKSREKICM